MTDADRAAENINWSLRGPSRNAWVVKDDLRAVLADRDRLAARVAELEALTRCPTPCDNDCDATCHQDHEVSYKRTHAEWMHHDLNRTQARVAELEAERESLRAEIATLSRSVKDWRAIEPESLVEWDEERQTYVAKESSRPGADDTSSEETKECPHAKREAVIRADVYVFDVCCDCGEKLEPRQ